MLVEAYVTTVYDMSPSYCKKYTLNARARTIVLSEAPSKPQAIEGNGGKLELKNFLNAIFLSDQIKYRMKWKLQRMEAHGMEA